MDNQVTVFGQNDPNEEFPVLRAFQQYINEEQNKARKRMVGLCCFFTVLMVVVIAVFMFMMFQLSSRNQALNDRLVELAMRTPIQQQIQPAQQPVIVQPAIQSNSDASLKAITDAIASLQRQFAEQQRATQEAMQKAQESVQPTTEELAAVGQETDKLKKVKAKMERERAKLDAERRKMDAERKKLAEEKERRRQEEVERQRRRLYPEYYAKEDTAKEAANTNNNPQPAAAPQTAAQTPSQPSPKQQPKRELSQSDIDELLKEVDTILEEGDKENESQSSGVAAEDDAMPAVSYFDDEKEDYEVPVKINNRETKWHVPID